MQAKGRRHSSLQLIGCSVTTRKRRRGGATKQLMGVCDKSVFTYKRGGGWGGLVSCSQDQEYFQGGKKPCTLKIQEMSRKLGSPYCCCNIWKLKNTGVSETVFSRRILVSKQDMLF